MGDLVDIAANIISGSERRLETVSVNVANTGTAGFKRQIPFQSLLENELVAKSGTVAADLQAGNLSQTQSALDMAITGEGWFVVQSDTQTYYTRQGTFKRGQDGFLETQAGFRVQSSNGSAIRLSSDRPEILEDGTILENGLPTAQIALVNTVSPSALTSLGGSLFTAASEHMQPVDTARLRQGMFETSNVTLADEMVTMMQAIREAETGARLVQAYDTLLGRAITTFGQGR